jgi:hypothetical protein
MAKPNTVKEVSKEVVASVKVIETEYRVMRPVFVDTKIEKPVYVERKVEVPAGIEELVIELASKIAEKVVASALKELDAKLEEAIGKRLKEIEVPTIRYVEQEQIVEKPVYKDVEVLRPVFKDRTVVNPVLVDKEVTNAVITDVQVQNAVMQDRIVINPVFTDVEIMKPKFIDKDLVVIHPKYIDMKGNPEPS